MQPYLHELPDEHEVAYLSRLIDSADLNEIIRIELLVGLGFSPRSVTRAKLRVLQRFSAVGSLRLLRIVTRIREVVFEYWDAVIGIILIIVVGMSFRDKDFHNLVFLPGLLFAYYQWMRIQRNRNVDDAMG
ncbi:MAG: hypothetical protein MN733_30675, partial [Nitrososphaera sp.]|nr:hypothetical protein [Nitrososphaera sp.]